MSLGSDGRDSTSLQTGRKIPRQDDGGLRRICVCGMYVLVSDDVYFCVGTSTSVCR